jgi:hypothetical protein
MSKCAIKRGFLVLRECGASTHRICPQCGTAACDEHMVADPGGKSWVCVDCFSKQPEPPAAGQSQADTQARVAAVGANPAAWRHRYRDQYYSDHGYAPFYAGAYYGSHFNDYDSAAFDRESAAAPDLGDDDVGDLMDS